MTVEDIAPADRDTVLRDQAIARLKKARGFQTHLLVYVLFNATTVVIWALTGRGFFWPMFLMLVWGVGLAMNAWDVYHPEEFTEEQIQREIARMQSR